MNATEKSLRRPDFEQVAAESLQPGERQRIETAWSELKQAIVGSDREAIQHKTRALNEATQHLAEVAMNRSVREALAGRNVKDV